jgi:hypothetical protein
MDKDQERLVGELADELLGDNLAIFAGAGLSKDAGFVDWKQLLAPIAAELGLDVNIETDLVALAQYHTNANQANRAKLNQLLVTEFSRNSKATENHKILARLPIATYWTTNYDTVIESALQEAGKIVDVKYTNKQLMFTKPKRDIVLYKMHGDVNHPADAVLIRDDYEKYYLKMAPFISALSGDLVSKTLLFLGFSFADPNLEYILGRVRVQYGADQRQHHCILRRVSRLATEEQADFEYRERKQHHFVQDLLRVGIKVTYVSEYSEVTTILRAVEERYKRNTVFISGAAHEYGRWSKDDAEKFVYQLSRDINAAAYRVVSGFGLGVGSSVITGVLEEIYMRGGRLDSDQLILRPFPQNQIGARPLPQLWTQYRKDMIAHAGVAIFLFGNKLADGKVVPSTGMREEFEIAKAENLFLIPVGITGYMAEELWKEVDSSFVEAKHRNGALIKPKLKQLGDPATSLDDARKVIIDVMALLKK